MKLIAIVFQICRRDLLIAYHQWGDTLRPLIFLCMIVTLFPLALEPERELLRTVAPGIIWIAALLSTLLNMHALFQRDYNNGVLEQLLMSPVNSYWFALAKVMTHWLCSGLPIIILSPLLGSMLFLSWYENKLLMLSLLLGTPTLAMITAIVSALTLSSHRGGFLMSIIALPLYIPVLIFGSGALSQAISGMAYEGGMLMLLALLLFCLSLAPLAISAAIKMSVD